MKSHLVLAIFAVSPLLTYGQATQPLTGQAAFAEWQQEKPRVLRKLTVGDLPQPYATQSVRNQPHIVPRPQNAWPAAPAGFKVTLYAGGDNGPSVSPDQ